MSDSVTSWTTAHQASLSFTITWSWLKLTPTESVMPSNHLSLCHPLLLPSVFPSIMVSSNESAKVLELQFQYQSFQWIFRTDFLPKNTQDWSPLGWTGLISLQSKRLLRVFSNTTVRKHQFYGTQLFFMIQFSHPYMTTGKTSSLTRRAFVGKTMSLLFNCCIGLSIAFLPKNKHLLIAVTICSDFGAQEN